jgi:hypothetical protein
MRRSHPIVSSLALIACAALAAGACGPAVVRRQSQGGGARSDAAVGVASAWRAGAAEGGPHALSRCWQGAGGAGAR